MWVLYSLLSAATGAGRSVYDKHLVSNETLNPLIIGFISFFVSVIVTAPIAIFLGEQSALTNQQFLFATAVNVVLNTINTFIYFRILQKHDASLLSGIQSVEPLFVVITAFLFVGETISPIGAAGIFVIICGSIWLQNSRSKECLQDHWSKSPWILMFLYMCFSSSATAFSKIAVLEGGAFIYIATRYAAIAAIFLLLVKFYKPKGAKQNPYKFKPAHIGSGLFLTASVIFEMLALEAAKAAYVEAIRRLTVFFSILFENHFLKTAWNPKRLYACILLFIGAAMIVLLG